jgi:sortase B
LLHSKWVRRLMIGVAVSVFAFSTYKISMYYADEYRSKEQYNELREIYYKTESEPEPIHQPTVKNNIMEPVDSQDVSTANKEKEYVVQERFASLLQMNEDVVGWLKIEGTVIDYPVMQAKDNDFYLYRDIHKKDNVNGSIFMDYRNRTREDDRHTILYGHNMKNKSMFASILNYESRWYFENHSMIEFDTIYQNGKWQIFSAYFTDENYDYIRTEFSGAEDYKAFLDDIKGRSLHSNNVGINENDIILTLSTCGNSSDVSRFAVHAKLIKDDSGL